MEQTKEKKYVVGSIICGLLTAFGIAAVIVSLLDGKSGMWLICDFAQIVLFIVIAYYAIRGYKKPHGNLLKYILLLFAARNLLTIQALVSNGITWRVILDAVRIGLICFTAGRLYKAKECLVLMIAVTVCVITAILSDAVSGIATIGAVAPLIMWLDICVAYFLRYKQHREAGLEDAPKK